MQPVRPACVGVRQTQRQGIAGYERPPVPTGHFRGNAQADVTQSLMGRKGDAPAGQPDGKRPSRRSENRYGRHAAQLRRGIPADSPRNRRHLGHGGMAFLQGCLPQGIRQNGGPCPKERASRFPERSSVAAWLPSHPAAGRYEGPDSVPSAGKDAEVR